MMDPVSKILAVTILPVWSNLPVIMASHAAMHAATSTSLGVSVEYAVAVVVAAAVTVVAAADAVVVAVVVVAVVVVEVVVGVGVVVEAAMLCNAKSTSRHSALDLGCVVVGIVLWLNEVES
jgi:hypothetical protein